MDFLIEVAECSVFAYFFMHVALGIIRGNILESIGNAFLNIRYFYIK